MTDHKYPIISVTGLCATGSSALFDLLKEYEGMASFPYEFRLLIDPDGIIDLGNALQYHWDDLNIDIAIRRFIQLCGRLDRDVKWYYPVSYNYGKILDGEFLKLIRKFLESLEVRSWKGTWPYHWHEYSSVKWLLFRILSRIKRESLLYKKDKIYLASQDTFIKSVRELFNDLSDVIAKGDNTQQVVFDQLIPACNCTHFMQYFYNIKTIIVDRDPRDVYVRGLIWPFIPTDNVDDYIYWYKTIRKQTYSSIDVNSSNVLQLKFENLIYYYDETVLEIEHFLSLNSVLHNKKKAYFVPDESKKNTKTWSKIDPSIIRKIEVGLPEYCFSF